MSWSSGKDAAWALHVLRLGGAVDVVGLFSVVSRDRVTMHAVREALLEAQAQRAGVPLWKVPIPDPCSAEQYADVMRRALEAARSAGVTHFAFGDVFLEEVRAAREGKLAPTGMGALFPLWGRDSTALAQEMLQGGLRARLVSVDPRQLPPELVGREFDATLLEELPPHVDRCGERGEFHTFAYDGPMFSRPVPFAVGDLSERDGFWYADLLAG